MRADDLKLSELLEEPIVLMVMRSDGVTTDNLRRLIRDLRRRATGEGERGAA